MIKTALRFSGLIILFLVFPAASLAQVSQIVFTTDPQSIRPNALSGPITIQTQDTGGNSFQTPETLDLQFISSSGTGEFLNSAGAPTTAYMSRNTANRTFYYRDATEGTFTITVNVRGRDSGIELEADQQITVSSGGTPGPTNDTNSSGEILGATSGTSSNSSLASGSNATYASSLNSRLEILAGSDRTTSSGSPIWFQASVKKNTTEAGIELSWSFGDGSVGVGPLVSHTYKYPGDYVVVLSARADDIFSVSRLKVKVAESNVSVSDRGDCLEIFNNSNAEINLFNWKVESGGKGFIFQPNTIILPHSSIRLDKSLLNMKGFDNSLGIVLENGLREEVFSAPAVQKTDLTEASKNLDNIKKEFSVIQEKAKNLGLASRANSLLSVSINQETKEPKDTAYSTTTDTNADSVIYEVPKAESFLKRTWKFIASLFD